jgi:hypothetical protein
VFFPKAEELEAKAKEAEAADQKSKAAEYYLSVLSSPETLKLSSQV